MTYKITDVNGKKVQVDAKELEKILNALYDEYSYYNPGIQGFINYVASKKKAFN